MIANIFSWAIVTLSLQTSLYIIYIKCYMQKEMLLKVEDIFLVLYINLFDTFTCLQI